MELKYKISKNPIESVFNDLKLFEQNNYCYDFLKKRFSELDDKVIANQAEIASACFRQASEYYKIASKASISTSSLLYSYALNNLLKGTCYLISIDDDILDGFKAHGFKVDNSFLKDDAMSSKVTVMKQKGAVHSLLKIYNNELIKQEIPLYKILRHIPGIETFYFHSLGSVSLLATRKNKVDNEYIIPGDCLNKETEDIMKQFSIMGNIDKRNEQFWCCQSMRSQGYLNDGTYDKNNIFYKEYMNIPDLFEEGMVDINIAFYCYILIMTYGMMVRYNANKWEKYIDKKSSSSSTLIELSIPNAVINFYYQMHFLLFGFYYITEIYDECDIKKIIKESTPDIMNNITKHIKDDNLRFGNRDYLPWREKVR